VCTEFDPYGEFEHAQVTKQVERGDKYGFPSLLPLDESGVGRGSDNLRQLARGCARADGVRNKSSYLRNESL
jgi:hypothetical protein